MAGLLYLPRIFVYHSEKKDHQNTSEIFKTMEKKLFNYIMMPAMILTWLFGLLLVSSLGFLVFLEFWMQAKVVFVLLLTFYHFYLGRCVKLFSINQNLNSSKFYRIINEVPTILLILIVFIVIFKPL
jgi:putative membrane protein